MGGHDDEGIFDYLGGKHRVGLDELSRDSSRCPRNKTLKGLRRERLQRYETHGRNLKEEIQRAVIDHDLPFNEMAELFKDRGISNVTIGNIRRDTRSMLRLLMSPEVGLIHPNDLARHRRKRARH